MIPPGAAAVAAAHRARRNPLHVDIADLVGGRTQNELLAFGSCRTRDGRWLARPEWRTS